MIDVTCIPTRGKRRLRHFAYLCPICGQLWARVRQDFGEHLWGAVHNSCETCPPAWANMEPGSIANHFEMDYTLAIADLPRDFQWREVELLARVDVARECAYNGSTIPKYELPMTLQDRIAELRSKVISKTETPEDLREAYRLLRAERMGASIRRETKAAATAKPDGASLLAKLQGLVS